MQSDNKQPLNLTLQQTTQIEETDSAGGNSSQHIWQHTARLRQENILFAYDLIFAFSVISKKGHKAHATRQTSADFLSYCNGPAQTYATLNDTNVLILLLCSCLCSVQQYDGKHNLNFKCTYTFA